MYETIVGAGIPFPHVMTYFVSSVEFVCGCLLIIGLLSTLCCMAFIIDMIVAITTVQLATITKALSFIDRLDDFLYLPEVMYIIIFLWLISSGPGRLSGDHWIAVRKSEVARCPTWVRDAPLIGHLSKAAKPTLKAGEEHSVPPSTAALALLPSRGAPEEPLFAGGIVVPPSEMCLAHKIGNASENAYKRSKLLPQRRQLMEEYARFVTSLT
jgi:uncharacterized membrane protein YphA (DoxX/SURF4 family)